MNPLTRSIISSVIMRLLAALGGILVTKGYLTPEQAGAIDWSEMVGAILVVISLILGGIKNFQTQRKIVTAIANPDIITEHQLEKKIADGGAASTMTPKTETPQVAA